MTGDDSPSLRERIRSGDGRGAAAAHQVRSLIARPFWTVIVGLLQFWYAFTKMAIGASFWKGLAKWALFKYHKAAGGDRVALDIRPNGVAEPIPVKWIPPDECGDDEDPGWRALGRDKTWQPNTLGQDGPRIGKTPVTFLDSDTWRETNVLEARIAEAVDRGDMRDVYRVDDAEIELTVNAENGAGAAEAVADGGQATAERVFRPRSTPIWEDMIVDINSGEAYDGSAISFRKVQEMLAETTTTDEMKAQEERAFIAGRSGVDATKFAIKVMLIAAAIIAIIQLGPPLIGALFGGGGGAAAGGSGGGIIPLSLGVV